MKIFLLDGPELSLAVAGGKGRNLNRMLAVGLPVPPGFVIPTAAYQEFVTDNQLAAQIESAWLTLLDADVPAFDATAEMLHLCFMQSSMSAEVASSIADAYSALGDGEPAVAVRSSATAEDLPNASFAGQQDTYLNIVGIDGVLDAVKRCWASLWTARGWPTGCARGSIPAQ